MRNGISNEFIWYEKKNYVWQIPKSKYYVEFPIISRQICLNKY